MTVEEKEDLITKVCRLEIEMEGIKTRTESDHKRIFIIEQELHGTGLAGSLGLKSEVKDSLSSSTYLRRLLGQLQRKIDSICLKWVFLATFCFTLTIFTWFYLVFWRFSL